MEHLAAAWETQRRYGGMARPKVAGEDGEAAPPFRHFVPGIRVREYVGGSTFGCAVCLTQCTSRLRGCKCVHSGPLCGLLGSGTPSQDCIASAPPTRTWPTRSQLPHAPMP